MSFTRPRVLAVVLLAAGLALLVTAIVLSVARRDVPIPALPDSEPWFSGIFNAIGALSLLGTGGYLVLKLSRNHYFSLCAVVFRTPSITASSGENMMPSESCSASLLRRATRPTSTR